jgi:hypothetical protein
LKKIQQSNILENKIENFIENKDLLYDERNGLYRNRPIFEFIRLKFSNSILTIVYILIKLLYLIIAIVQILMMNTFLSNKQYNFYGSEVINNILNGRADLGNSTDSKIFPK